MRRQPPGRSSDSKAAAIALDRAVPDRRGDLSDADLRAVGDAGHGDAEIVAHVALNVFTNYFSRLARTSIDL